MRACMTCSTRYVHATVTVLMRYEIDMLFCSILLLFSHQYYIKLDEESRYVDLGLQTHRVKCRVHNNFK